MVGFTTDLAPELKPGFILLIHLLYINILLLTIQRN